MTSTHDRIPAHLREYVVHQNYDGYDEVDQAVWRFILLQTFDRLRAKAHPAYARGLEQTGISMDHIPRIDEMDRRLSEYGWGAVCVKGFIPPRVFQEFQALGIMTIAADIRSANHLAYTPAPDIVHEAAGHAPIIPDHEYSNYLRRFGEIGARAFSCPGDTRIDRAIFALSVAKEDPFLDPDRLVAAEAELEAALGATGGLSEAARISRLHWWTVEYGLLGVPGDYQIYGAGLLSSLGESESCHQPKVDKLPLRASCTDVGYDITSPQPQLFVAESFAELGQVLGDVAGELAQNTGGSLALGRALASREVGTLEFENGLQVCGVLAEVRGDLEAPTLSRFAGPWALARSGAIAVRSSIENADHVLVHGPLMGEFRLGDCADAAVCRHFSRRETRTAGTGAELEFVFRSGVRVRGRLQRRFLTNQGDFVALGLSAASVWLGEDRIGPEMREYPLAISDRLTSAFAGAPTPEFWPETEFGTDEVPSARPRDDRAVELAGLYRDALALWEKPDDEDFLAGFERLADELARRFPKDWLLRWNLLECLRKVDHGVVLACELRDLLLQVERQDPDNAAIALGLRHLGFAIPPQVLAISGDDMTNDEIPPES
jgi:phenylalanine-4-hydroxylase